MQDLVVLIVQIIGVLASFAMIVYCVRNKAWPLIPVWICMVLIWAAVVVWTWRTI